jgi:hypothetical protein
MVGWNWTLSVAVWPGFNMSGNWARAIVKPVPVSAAASIVRGSVPVAVTITDCVADVFTATFSKARLVVLMLSVCIVAFNCRAKVWETPPALAVNFTACSVSTDDTFAVN